MMEDVCGDRYDTHAVVVVARTVLVPRHTTHHPTRTQVLQHRAYPHEVGNILLLTQNADVCTPARLTYVSTAYNFLNVDARQYNGWQCTAIQERWQS
eukprot:m.574739 g.574739  ORF g.574739 m.574739 type:complete len:97 (-) comp22282_c0_seq4:2222-2512(-)